MQTKILLDELPANLREVLTRNADSGEPILVIDNERTVAEIRKLPQAISAEMVADKFAALPQLTPAEAEAFGKDIDESRIWLNQLPVHAPWQE